MKAIPGYKGLYSATKTGRIYSHGRITRARAGKTRCIKPKWMSKTPTKIHGYVYATLVDKNGVATKSIVARWILLTFDRKPKNGEEPNHKNLIKTDDRLSNLEWLTHSDNSKHARNNGKHYSPFGDISSEDHHKAKLTEQNIIYIRKNYRPRSKTYCLRALASRFNVSISTIHSILKGQTWRNT